MIVVIPSNRQINLDYLRPLIESGARFIIVDDSEGSIRVDHPQFEVYTWADRRSMLGKLDAGFPKRNGASRDFGFYVAWRNSDPGEIVIALDDDCEVYLPDFAAQVSAGLSPRARPVASCDGRHLNILELYQGVPSNLYPRGFPYAERARADPMRLSAAALCDVHFNLGLWRGVFDVNAVDKIRGPAYVHPQAQLKRDAVVVDVGHLVSVCSMNMQFRRELIPAVYQLPMHVEVLPGWVVDRYGDIWGGFILKALMDRRGQAMAVGGPMINHLKEGSFVNNIWQEHVCHMINDEFVDLLMRCVDDIALDDYLPMVAALGERFAQHADAASPLLKPYLRHLAAAMAAWVEALS